MANPLVVQGTSVAAIAPATSSYSFIYQLGNGTIQQKNETADVTDVGPAAISSPLAAVTWNDGNEIRVYTLDQDNNILEFSYTEGGNWTQSIITVHGSTVQAAPGAGLAASATKVKDLIRIQVFFQGFASSYVKELTYNNGWSFGPLAIQDALANTSLAAAAYTADGQVRTHVFYQNKGLALSSYFFDGSWKKGGFNPSVTTSPARTALAAVSFTANQLPHVQIYWRGSDGKVNFGERTGAVWGKSQPTNLLTDFYNFAVIQWSNGKKLRLFNQNLFGSFNAYESNDGGKTWTSDPDANLN